MNSHHREGTKSSMEVNIRLCTWWLQKKKKNCMFYTVRRKTVSLQDSWGQLENFQECGWMENPARSIPLSQDPPVQTALLGVLTHLNSGQLPKLTGCRQMLKIHDRYEWQPLIPPYLTTHTHTTTTISGISTFKPRIFLQEKHPGAFTRKNIFPQHHQVVESLPTENSKKQGGEI
jgi:hypothetical protein